MKEIKISTHIIFDEANMSLPPMVLPLASMALQKLSYQPDPTNDLLDDANIGLSQCFSVDYCLSSSCQTIIDYYHITVTCHSWYCR